MKKIGSTILVLLLLICTSCAPKNNLSGFPKEIQSLKQLKQFRLFWGSKTKYEGFTIKKDAITGKTSFEQGVQFMSGDWDYDFICYQTLRNAIQQEKSRSFFKFIPFYRKIDDKLRKLYTDPAKLVVQWNMGINVDDGINRFQNLVKDCINEMPPNTTPDIDWGEEERKKVEEEIFKLKHELNQLIEKIEIETKKSEDYTKIKSLKAQAKTLLEKIEELEKSITLRLLKP
jgi:hypothetical protein